MPMPVYTFLESYDFSGKTVIPFDTNGNNGLGGTVDSIKMKPGRIRKRICHQRSDCPAGSGRDGERSERLDFRFRNPLRKKENYEKYCCNLVFLVKRQYQENC